MIANKQINKQINFTPEFMTAEKEQVHRIIVIVIVTIIFTLLSFGIYYFPEIKLVSLDSQLDSTNTAIQLLGEAKQLKAKLDETQAKLKKKKEIIDEINKTQVDVIFIMNKLIAAAPKNVILSYFSASSRDNIIASYVVNNPIEAADLVANLRKSEIFESVDMPTIPIADKKVDISFKLKLKPKVEAKEEVKQEQSNTTAASTSTSNEVGTKTNSNN